MALLPQVFWHAGRAAVGWAFCVLARRGCGDVGDDGPLISSWREAWLHSGVDLPMWTRTKRSPREFGRATAAMEIDAVA
jgi:hypothetical protein